MSSVILGYITSKPGRFQATKVPAYGGCSSFFEKFEDALGYVNGSVRPRAKIRDVTRAGRAGSHGGPTTWEVWFES
jgi:hypothetical protein